jgi:DNA-binding MurR/RpiR family transcriptional regulator
MHGEQLQLLGEQDAIIAASFPPYAAETLSIVNAARERGVKIVAITDPALSPLALQVDVCFEIEDGQIQGIRSLAAPLCLAVSLVVGLGQHLEAKGKRRRSRAAPG